MKYLPLVYLLFLVACQQTPVQKTMTMCTGVASAIQTLAIHKDQLSQDQIDKVVKAIDIITPVCGEGSAPVTDQGDRERAETAVKFLLRLSNDT